MRVTAGHLLGGRLRYAQPADGYRTGIEPVLLAAAIPALPGERVLEAGTGAGAGLMCLAARVPGMAGTGVEIDPAMAELARQNLAANGLAGFEVVTADIRAYAGVGFDHAFANPPWHDPGSTPSPLERRRLAKQGSALEDWIAALARSLRQGGTLTLILPVGLAGRAAPSMRRAGLETAQIIPLIPKQGKQAKLALITSAPAIDPGIVLHEADGAFTPAIEAVLRHGAALPIR
ncbi:MAG TPA: methyltransferase [Acetobacteraceae bacterium]|nr:methyltransferase [Acetobacteraceae bacterium]